MGGAYNGTAFGANSWWESVTGRSNDQMTRYHAMEPVRDARREEEERQREAAARRAAVRVPGAGPAAPAVVALPGLGVLTPGLGVRSNDGLLPGGAPMAPTTGPGRSTYAPVTSVGPRVPVTTGPGNPAFLWGTPNSWTVDRDDGWYTIGDTETATPKGFEGRTPYRQFGVDIQPSPWFTDAQYFEDRVGDDGPATWLNNMFTPVADYVWTFGLGFDATMRAGQEPEVRKNLTGFNRMLSDAYVLKHGR